MIRTEHALQPYSEYRDSGVPWLGAIPAHWEIKPLKHWLNINEKVLSESTSVNYRFRYIDIGAVETGVLTHQPENMVFSEAPSRARRILRQGDTIVSTVRTYLKAVYHISNDASDLICSTGFAVLTPRKGINPKFLSYLAQSSIFTDRVSAESVGIAYPAIAESRLASLKVSIPFESEQATIVRFLEHIDRRVNRFVRAKRRLVALLNEQKQAIIHRAVTRGLDPDARLKPSGVAWLGDVPEHWEVLRTKYVYHEVDNRSTTGNETHLSMSQKLGLVPNTAIEERRLVSESYIGAKLCNEGDLVLNRLKAHLGVFALATQSGLVSPDYTVFRPTRKIHNRYFEFVLRTPACRVELRKRAKGIVQGFWRLYTDDFYDIHIPVPSFDEQNQIVDMLDIELQELDNAINRTEREIDLIREYRTRLVADVVTGKLDVRGVALPDDLLIEDDTPLDTDDLTHDADSELTEENTDAD